MGELLSRWHAALSERSPVAIATVIEGPQGALGGKILVTPEDHVGTAGDHHLDRAIVEAARGLLEGGRTDTVHFGPRGERRMEDVSVFVQSFAPPPRMYVFGAIDFASAVARIGKFLGYRVTVCDARAVFATRERFPTADEVVVAWPHDFLKGAEVDKRTVVCVLTHDPKFDVPVLVEALKTEAGYIGAMGSRRTHDERTARLKEEGVTDEELTRICTSLCTPATPGGAWPNVPAPYTPLRRKTGGEQRSSEARFHTSFPSHADVLEGRRPRARTNARRPALST